MRNVENGNMQTFDLHHLDYDDAYTNGSTGSSTDNACRIIHKNTAAFHIWRIENMSLVSLPRDQYGTFYNTECYIVYAASVYGQISGVDTVHREMRGSPMEYHIHFWLGSLTTPERSGVAAYKTVELDNHLGGMATQHRETQGNESSRFKSYFKNGYRVLKGEGDPILSTTRNHSEPKLYKVKGKRNPIIIQEEQVSWNYFNSGDVFLVHTPDIIFVWTGRAANGIERLHGAKAALELKTESRTPNVVFVDDGYEQTLSDGEKKEFNRFLPLNKRMVMPPDYGGDDDDKEKQHRTGLKLYRCSDNSGKYRVTEVKSGPIVQSDLNSDDVYIIDHAANGIWVWVGKHASEKERTEALRNARGFVKKKNYGSTTSVTRIVDGAEPLEFKSLFLAWKDKEDPKVAGKNHINGKHHKVVAVTKFDATLMHERPMLAAECQLVDDGSGTMKVWRVNRTDTVEVPKDRYGTFFNGDCYIVVYAYKTTVQNYIVYYWLGAQATQDEMEQTEEKVVETDDELERSTVQVRVVQGHEPAHFLQLFFGRMVVFRGRSTDYAELGRNAKGPSSYLLQIFGSSSYSAKAVHAHCKATSLNSNYCYVLRKYKHYYIWCGSYSTGDQREMAKGFVGKDFELVLEGKETLEFWDSIGGKSGYTTTKLTNDVGSARPPRLFHCSLLCGQSKAEEILNFAQSDLTPENVMLLDASCGIFVWIGTIVKHDRKAILDMVKDYITIDPAGRNADSPILLIKQGHEPPNFTGFFSSWTDEAANAHQTFEQLRNSIEGSNINLAKRAAVAVSKPDDSFDKYTKYPLNVLTAATDKLPNKVDAQKKELHLTHDDFVSLFKMRYEEFGNLPKWKQQEMKKKVGLF